MKTFARIVLWLIGMLLGLLSSPWAQAVTPMVAAGDSHSVALSVEGKVYAWGNDDYGQLGLGRPLHAIAPQVVHGVNLGPGTTRLRLAAGAEHSLVVKADGSLWTWGGNVEGSLGDGTTTDSSIPCAVTIESS